MSENYFRFVLVLLTIIGFVNANNLLDFSSLKNYNDKRIVGGEIVSIYDHPFMASLHFFHQHLCGAAVLSSRWIITAAHCTTLDLGFSVNPIRGFTVRVGTDILETDGEEISVLRIFDHPTFLHSDPIGLDYDISVMFLERDIVISATVQPLRLPESDEIFEAGTTALAFGWGVTSEAAWDLPENLKKVEIPLLTNEECEIMYQQWNVFNYVTDRMICAGHAEGGRGTCYGDSGGPLIVNGTLLGLFSWSFGCARPNAPGLFTGIQAMGPWIRETTGLY